MKKFVTLLIAFTAILNFSCKEDKIGPDDSHAIYFLRNDELVCAHNQTVDIPSREGITDIRLVAKEIIRIRILDRFDSATVELMTDCSSENAVVYDYLTIPSDGSYRKIPRYIQIIRVTAPANTGRRDRKMKIRVETKSGRPENADITIRQRGSE